MGDLRILSKEAVYAWDEEPITSSKQTGNCQNHPENLCYGFRIEVLSSKQLIIHLNNCNVLLLLFLVSMANALPCPINLVGYIQVKMEAIAFCRLLTLSGADK